MKEYELGLHSGLALADNALSKYVVYVSDMFIGVGRGGAGGRGGGQAPQ